MSDNAPHELAELQHSDKFASEGIGSGGEMLTTDGNATVVNAAKDEQGKHRQSFLYWLHASAGHRNVYYSVFLE